MFFQILPAIDLMDGGCVRLQQGDASRKTRYEVDPGDVARSYENHGARRIHVVDLDGAFGGKPANLDAIRKIRKATSVEIEVGGGIRSRATLQTLFDAGVNYAVIGTKALEDLDFLQASVQEFGERIIVGADARNGYLSTRGWTQDTQHQAVPYLTQLFNEVGIRTVIFTDIARDGMFTAPNMDALIEVLNISPELQVIASGGVGTVEHIQALAEMHRPNLLGVIVGKAISDGRVNLKVAHRRLAEITR